MATNIFRIYKISLQAQNLPHKLMRAHVVMCTATHTLPLTHSHNELLHHSPTLEKMSRAE